MLERDDFCPAHFRWIRIRLFSRWTIAGWQRCAQRKGFVRLPADSNVNMRGDKSFAYDLDVQRSIVSSRVALLLRSAEIKLLLSDLSKKTCPKGGSVQHRPGPKLTCCNQIWLQLVCPSGSPGKAAWVACGSVAYYGSQVSSDRVLPRWVPLWVLLALYGKWLHTAMGYRFGKGGSTLRATKVLWESWVQYTLLRNELPIWEASRATRAGFQLPIQEVCCKQGYQCGWQHIWQQCYQCGCKKVCQIICMAITEVLADSN